jgi:DNA repair exonuclease SbcCD ATPase subunit
MENDPVNLIGIETLFNSDGLDTGISTNDIEKMMMGNDNVAYEEAPIDDDVDIVELYEEDNIDKILQEESEEEEEEPDNEDVKDDAIDGSMNFMGMNAPPQQASTAKPMTDEEKMAMYEEIDELLNYIEETHTSIKNNYKHITMHSDVSEMRETLLFLRAKYQRIRSQTLSKELMLLGASFAEYLFDGKKKYGPFSPDLTGWSNTIRPKIRRIQNETSTIVSDIMTDYKLGPWFRVGMELIPSAIIYSKVRKEQYGQKSYTPHQMSEAYDELASFDNVV